MELINNKYLIVEKLGNGRFGSIYKGVNIRTNNLVAIKIEKIENELRLLKNESIIYQYLKNCEGIPQVKWYGKDDNNYYMVINLLGHSLQNLINNIGKFSLALTLKIGIKIVNLLKIIHEKGFIHRDIKPDNFLFGLDKLKDIFIIDFGFCKSYLIGDKHIKNKKNHGLIGSKNYASLNSQEFNELSRRDDLESVCYMLIYFISGNLPWNSLSNDNDIIKLKREIVNSELYPQVITETLKYVRNLEFEEKPNYYLIIDNFKKEIEFLSKTN
jgi:serine/threonine protein kinase